MFRTRLNWRMEALWRLLNPLRECAWRTWPLNVNPKHSDGKCSRKYIRFIPLAPLRHAVRVHRTIYGHHAICVHHALRVHHAIRVHTMSRN